MKNLRRLGNRVQVPIKPDQDGYFGRECPGKECLGYFKITPGTGIQIPAPCHCPYCGFIGGQEVFYTQDQIEFAKSVALRQVVKAVTKDLNEWGRSISHAPSGIFGIKIEAKVNERAVPIRYYREQHLETEVVCDSCTLRYAIYGAFGFCPDCGIHNSLQILEKNLELSGKQITLAALVEKALADHLTGNALEVSSFDGFGRESCKVRAAKATDPAKAENISFQSLSGAQRKVQAQFGVDLAAGLPASDWDFACRCFQKRHLLAHKMGIVDVAYLAEANDSQAVLGRKIVIKSEEVVALLANLRKIGAALLAALPAP